MSGRPETRRPAAGRPPEPFVPSFDLVLGTDTGVGKTLVASRLAAEAHRSGQRTCVLKPVQSGALASDPEGDLARYPALSGVPDLPVGSAYVFSDPLDPMTAASRSGVSIEPDRILALVRQWGASHDRIIVEGVGGVLSPVFPDGSPLFSAFPGATRKTIRTVLVSHPHLGCLSQVLSCVRILEREGLYPACLYLVRRPGLDPYPDATAANPDTLKRLLPDLPIATFDSPLRP